MTTPQQFRSDPLTPAEALSAITEAAKLAGQAAKKVREQTLTITEKADLTFVTAGDLASEKAALQFLKDNFPAIPVVSEETPVGVFPVEHSFVIDPIDGTSDYMNRGETWGVLAAYQVGGEPIAGITFQPMLERTITAAKGIGCFCNDQRMPQFQSEMPFKSSILSFEIAFGHPEMQGRLVTSAAKRFCVVRSTGTSIGAIVDFALGRSVAYLQPKGAKIWDLAPGTIIARELGGVAFDVAGNELRHLDTNSVGVFARTRGQALEILKICEP